MDTCPRRCFRWLDSSRQLQAVARIVFQSRLLDIALLLIAIRFSKMRDSCMLENGLAENKIPTMSVISDHGRFICSGGTKSPQVTPYAQTVQKKFCTVFKFL